METPEVDFKNVKVDEPSSPSTSNSKKSRYRQKYSRNWNKDDTISKWLKPSSKGEAFGFCVVCNTHLSIKGGKSDLYKHAAGKKHLIKFQYLHPDQAHVNHAPAKSTRTNLRTRNAGRMEASADAVDDDVETNGDDTSRSDAVGKEMGQLLLQGYKLLLSVCHTCECILMEDEQGMEFCVGCTLDQESKNAAKAAAPTPRPSKKIKVRKTSKPAAAHPPQSNGRVMVHGVDLTEELQQAVAALKNKLSLLSQRLYSIDDHAELSDCLKSMSSIGVVIERYRQIW
ncbi:Sjoegren syndrome/scleroderma autoantigen 1 [Trinorchestia longiramus]|nr:Sjoegren syndrome/scleroderma autoantigen 1 [Trinorchestia longiramus]